MARCPNCGNENPAGAFRCDCGYSFLTGEVPAGTTRPSPPESPMTSAEAGGASADAPGAGDPLPGAAGEPPPIPPEPPPTVTYRLAFRGTARDYFGIWIVNMLLKIVTIGFYTAWAKVRQRRYFAGTTLLEGEPFEYLAEPKALFRGWLIAVAAVVIYSVVARYSPAAGFVIGLAIFCAVPWVVVRSRIFNARNLAHRNIRFAFRPNYAESYRVYLGYALLVPLTLGIIYPYMIYRQKRFLAENSSYGAMPFRFTARPKDFYVFFFQAAMAMLGLLLVFGGVAAVVASWAGPALKRAPYLAALIPFVIVPFYFMFAIGVMAALNNLVWNKTELGGIRFVSDMSPTTVVWLYLSGFVAVALSLGLLFPWAAVRLRRYRYDHLALQAAGGIDGFVAGAQAATVGAAGEEIGDAFGLDLDIAL